MLEARDEDRRRDPSGGVRSALVLLGFVALSMAVGGLGSLATAGNVDGWYADAEQPAWTPPDWVFAPVWTFLYVTMAVAAWLVWRRGGFARQRRPLTYYAVQLALNLAWTPVFFAAQEIELALAVIVVLDVVLAATLAAFWRTEPRAGALLVPYLAWTLFATSLNAGFVVTL